MHNSQSKKIKFTVLSKSKKYGNYCVAGLDQDNSLIRLVSDDSDIHNALDAASFTNEKDEPIKLGDIIEVEIYEDGAFDELQPENRLIKNYEFRHIGEISVSELFLHTAILDDYPFFNNKPYIPHEELKKHIGERMYSLIVVHAPTLILHINESEDEKRTLLGNFYFKDESGITIWCNDYRITDEEFKDKYYDKVKDSDMTMRISGNRYIKIKDVVLTISLGEEYLGNHYKLIAAVFENE